jgi:hypothetical protein
MYNQKSIFPSNLQGVYEDQEVLFVNECMSLLSLLQSSIQETVVRCIFPIRQTLSRPRNVYVVRTLLGSRAEGRSVEGILCSIHPFS